MSVTLEEFCDNSQSKFAEALEVALRNGVLIRADEITIEEDDDGVRAYVDVMHTLTRRDAELMISVFDGLYWQITTSTERCTFRVVFYLTPGWL